MSVSFQGHAGITGVNRGRVECDVMELEYDGELPAGLDGAFYRAGTDAQFPSRYPADNRWGGDGMITLLRIQGGHVDLKTRYVLTERLKADRAARRGLFGAYRNRFTDDPSVRAVDRTTANTTPVWYAGRLLATKEDGIPYVLDPLSLETRGRFDFDGKLRSATFSSHPKKDPDNGELVFFGYEASGDASTDIAVCLGSPDGAELRETWFQAPFNCMMHDFAVSKEHIIFWFMPTTSDLDRLKAGGPHWAWDETKHTIVGIMPRNGSPAEMRYFNGPPLWSFHVMNAYTAGDKVVCDLAVSDVNPAVMPRELFQTPEQLQKSLPYMERCEFDLAGNEDGFKRERFFDLPAEFCSPDPRWRMKDYRYGFAVAKDVKGRPERHNRLFSPYDMLVRFDLKTGEQQNYTVDERSSVEEPIFVPRSPDAPEGDGFLICVCMRPDEFRSDVLVFDTGRDLAEGPVATIKLPIQLAPSFHVEFVTGPELAA